MSTYLFVKVAAGEPFPFETDFHITRTDKRQRYRMWAVNGKASRVDRYILRPVEPAAGEANSAAVDPVALLEWVAREKWQYRGEGEWYRNERTKYKNKFVGKNTAALIQEFINQQTKEV